MIAFCFRKIDANTIFIKTNKQCYDIYTIHIYVIFLSIDLNVIFFHNLNFQNIINDARVFMVHSSLTCAKILKMWCKVLLLRKHTHNNNKYHNIT